MSGGGRPIVRSRIVGELSLAFAAVISAAAAFAMFPPSDAKANSLNCGTTGDYFDGYYGNYGQGNTEGTYALISAREVSECNNAPIGNSQNATMAYAMVAANGGGGWVQSGYLHTYGGGCVVFFAEVSKTGSSASIKTGGSCLTLDGTNHGFEEDYGSACGCEYAKIDGTVWMTTSFDPFGTWSYPFSPQFMGEAFYRESDMPGAAATPTDFARLQGQNGSNNNYYDFSCNGFLLKRNDGKATRSDGNAWYDQQTSCPEFQIYTAPAGG